MATNLVSTILKAFSVTFTLPYQFVEMKKKWYEVKFEAGADKARIDIDGTIGDTVSSAMFAWELEDLKKQGAPELELYINSPGGSMWDGNSICNQLIAYPSKKTGIVIGLCASMASVILMACDERYMAANAQLMIHDPILVGAEMKIEEMDGIKNMLIGLRDTAADMYSKATGIKKADILKMMAVTTWFSAKDALKNKFIHGIREDIKEVAQPHNLAKFQFKNVPQNLMQPQEENMSDPKKETKDAPKVENVAPDVVAMRKEIEDMKKERAQERATLLVENGISQKKITADAKEKWIKMAVADFDSTKEILDGMKPPVNISATLNTGTGDGIATAESRESWGYDDWAKKDPSGLATMKAQDNNRFQTLLSAKLKAVNAKGIVTK